MKNTFSKEERLCSKRLIESLFHNGSSFVVYPYRVVIQQHPEALTDYSAQSIISVSKRRFKHAVDRNAIKRKIRECYRLQKGAQLYPFLEEKSLNLTLALQYVGKESLAYSVLTEKMGVVIQRIKNECTKLYLGETN